MSANRVDGNLWIRRYHPAPTAAVRLVCLPHAGGSASYFFSVSKELSPDFDVLAVQYPGRQDRRGERCIDSIAELADEVTAELLPETDLPLVLFGHSMGATLAFEVARRLERRGIVPVALFASGRRAPSHNRDEGVHRGSDEEIIAELKKLSGTQAALLGDEEILRMVLPAIRSDYKAAETYRYVDGPPLSTPIQAHFGVDDPRVSREEAAAWADHTTGPFQLHSYPGGHFYLNDEAPRLIEAIAKVGASVGP
ncbi:thioesterase II family protein [Streptomyces sp. NPDC101151]|uniref:thioesterase II family protein n=1 Tax=Streptomyces sp. NPDC101151 TaxID=3366115 RepID=UPI00382232FB